VLRQLVDAGLDAQAALDAPRVRWMGGDVVAVEEDIGEGVVEALGDAGFSVLEQPLHPGELGAGQVIRVHEDGWLEGGADSRRDGVASGR
jgi:gamma-glutamyltranspeptidase/glutathione hydrolase